MKLFIKNQFVIQFIIMALISLPGCNAKKNIIVPSDYLKGMNKTEFISKQGQKFNTYLAKSDFQQMKGLSGTQPEQFSKFDAMLFVNERDESRSFWMPDTHFNLDIFFLDENHKILFVERNVPHHPGRENLENVYRTGHYRCRHVLELKTSEESAKIKIGDQLKFQNY